MVPLGVLVPVLGCSLETGVDSFPPVVVITAPVDGAVVASSTDFTADAVDDRGVAFVRFYQGNTLLAKDPTQPYGTRWATQTVPDGQYVLRAEAVDEAGNSSLVSVQVTVRNSPFVRDDS